MARPRRVTPPGERLCWYGYFRVGTAEQTEGAPRRTGRDGSRICGGGYRTP